MKKSIILIAATTLISSVIFTGCNSAHEKVENAEEKVIEANEDLDKANDEYLEDVQAYRITTAEKIKENNLNIAEFKARIAKDKKEAKADYKERIAELEQKNTDMQKRMDDYQVNGKEKWEIFKKEFSHDMDEFGKAFKDLTVKNVK
jgi:ABC-type nitrate/sulfonate/bicarbonate transport system substrate-binding protein